MPDLTKLLQSPADTVHQGSAALQSVADLLSVAGLGSDLANVGADNLGYLIRLVVDRLDQAELEAQAQHEQLLELRFPNPSKRPL